MQLIRGSHSEHPLLRLQRRIVEQNIFGEDGKPSFCYIRRGASVLTPFKLDPFGRIDNWAERLVRDPLGEAAGARRVRFRRIPDTAE